MKKTVIARLFIKEKLTQDFKEQAAVIIQKTRTEKGCLFYSLFQDVSHPGEFLFYEEYASKEALDIHFKSEYLKTFRASIIHMQSKDSVVEII